MPVVPARVKDGRKSLRGIVQPGRWFSSGYLLRQGQDVECLQVAEFASPSRKNDHRLGVVEHVGDQGVGQGGVQEHHGSTSLENPEVGGHGVPAVLRHGHGHHLVRTSEERRKGRRHPFRLRVKLSEGQALSGVRDLQGREIRELLRGTAEDLCQPPDAPLMRHFREVSVVEDIRQAVLAGVYLPLRHLRRPKISPPRQKSQPEEDRENGSC
jgi:hypothetical protein